MILLCLWWEMFTDVPDKGLESNVMRGLACLLLPLFLGLAPLCLALELVGWAAGVATRCALRLYERLTV